MRKVLSAIVFVFPAAVHYSWDRDPSWACAACKTRERITHLYTCATLRTLRWMAFTVPLCLAGNLFRKWLRTLCTWVFRSAALKHCTEAKRDILKSGCSESGELWTSFFAKLCSNQFRWFLIEIVIVWLSLSHASTDTPVHCLNWGMCRILTPTLRCSPSNKHSCAWQNLINRGSLFVNRWNFVRRSCTWYFGINPPKNQLSCSQSCPEQLYCFSFLFTYVGMEVEHNWNRSKI